MLPRPELSEPPVVGKPAGVIVGVALAPAEAVGEGEDEGVGDGVGDGVGEGVGAVMFATPSVMVVVIGVALASAKTVASRSKLLLPAAAPVKCSVASTGLPVRPDGVESVPPILTIPDPGADSWHSVDGPRSQLSKLRTAVSNVTVRVQAPRPLERDEA
jgi:hypothetical protein